MSNDIDRALDFLRANSFSEAANEISVMRGVMQAAVAHNHKATAKTERRDDALRKVGRKYRVMLIRDRKRCIADMLCPVCPGELDWGPNPYRTCRTCGWNDK